MSKGKTIIGILFGILFVFVVYNFYTTFSLSDDYSFKSDFYRISDGYIYNVSPYTDVSLYFDYFDLDNCSVVVKDSSGREITDGYVMNGSYTEVVQNHQVVASYVNVIMGDIYEDGVIDDKDFSKFGMYLVDKFSIAKYLEYSLDIDGKDGIHLNDLMLLENTIKNGYQDLSLSIDDVVLQEGEEKRVIADIIPHLGLSFNAKWISNDSSIASVRQSGVIKGIKEGNTSVLVETSDGKIQKSVNVKIDNTIQLSSYSGNVYQEGEDLVVSIKSIDYSGIECVSSNSDAVSCRIDGDKLYLRAGNTGSSVITVSSPNYGSRTFNATSISPYINLQYSDYDCLSVGARPSTGIFISSMNAGKLSFDISDTDIIEYAYQEGNRFIFKAGNKTGRGQVVIRGSNSNRTKVFTLDVYRLSFPDIGGVGTVGEEIVGNMIALGVGELSCSSADETKATCRIEDGKLYVKALQAGAVTITVSNSLEYNGVKRKCGSAQFLAVIREGS